MAHKSGSRAKAKSLTKPGGVARRRRSGYHKILVALDFSKASSRALEEGVELARIHDAKLVLCTALTPVIVLERGFHEGAEPSFTEDEFDRAEARLHAMARATGLSVEEYDVRVVRRDPGIEIPKLADVENCDLIIVANRGHSPKRRFFLGSVAERILRNSRTTVLVSKGS